MMHKVYLVHWNAVEAEEKAAELRKAGYEVAYEALTPAILRDIRNRTPDAFVIDLTRLPSHGRDVALSIRQTRATRRVPLVFVDGDPEKVKGIRGHLPDAVYASWSRIHGSLKQAISHPPADPVVPMSVLTGYSNTPLPKKLGIKEHELVALIKAPSGFKKSLGGLPESTKLTDKLNVKCDLIIWFVRSQKDLGTRIKAMIRALANSGSLWIAWPKKTSGLESDLSQITVRKVGLTSGLVDFKVCSIDETWSGLKFVRRRPK